MSHSSTQEVSITSLNFPAPDIPNFFGQYFMLNGTDYAQQTRAINAIDDETIRENDFNEIRRIVCYNQSIYNDIRLEDDEWLGLTLSVDRASVLTNVRPMYDQAAIMIQDNDRRNTMLITFYNLCCIHVHFYVYLQLVLWCWSGYSTQFMKMLV